MGYAFISYSTKNQSEADAVRTLLIKNNIQTWMAPIDIPAGSKYAGVIVDAIKKCACLVLLLTEESQQSQWVEREVERAVNYRKSIITIQLEDLVLNECFELYIGNQQIVYAKQISETSAEIQKILNAVIALTGSDAEEKKPAPTTLPASGTDAKAQKRQPEQKSDPAGDLGRGFMAAFFGERKNAKDVAVPKQVEPKPENKEPKTRPQKSTTDSNGSNVGDLVSILAQKNKRGKRESCEEGSCSNRTCSDRTCSDTSGEYQRNFSERLPDCRYHKRKVFAGILRKGVCH